MGKSATPGNCPYCKNALNSGATACTGCGAFETTGWAELGMWKGSLLGFCFFIGPLMAIFVAFFSPIPGLIILIASVAGYFVFRSRLKRKIVWAVGGRRPM